MNARAAPFASLIAALGPGPHAQSLPSRAELQARADSNDPVVHYALAQGFLQAIRFVRLPRPRPEPLHRPDRGRQRAAGASAAAVTRS